MLMRLQLLMLILMGLVLQGCAGPTYRSLTIPVEREEVGAVQVVGDYSSLASLDKKVTRVASVGDEMFLVDKYVSTTVTNEHIRMVAPTSRQFPENAQWTGTHVYNDRHNKNATIYTSPDYYKGSIGVILDENGRVVTEEPLIQVSGKKQGRRWPLSNRGEFFVVEKLPGKQYKTAPWALIYAGIHRGHYRFDVVDRSVSGRGRVLQTIKLSEAEFLAGFSVKGIWVKGSFPDNNGTIQYRIDDRS